MGMSIAHNSYQPIWVPVKPAATIYVGGIVGFDINSTSEGVEMIPAAGGVANATNLDIPFGIVIGTNRKEPLFDTTYKCEYITAPAAADAHDGASIEYVGVEGPWAKGDPVPMVKIDVILPNSIIRAPIFKSAVGTAPTVVTCSYAGSSGITGTFGTIDFAPTANDDSTLYFRSGNNAGAYRVMNGTSQTALTWDIATRNDVEVGCTAVAAPLRPVGPATVVLGATCASYIDCANSPVEGGTTRWAITVLRLDLSEAGKEYVEFMFQSHHFTNFATPAAS